MSLSRGLTGLARNSLGVARHRTIPSSLRRVGAVGSVRTFADAAATEDSEVVQERNETADGVRVIVYYLSLPLIDDPGARRLAFCRFCVSCSGSFMGVSGLIVILSTHTARLIILNSLPVFDIILASYDKKLC